MSTTLPTDSAERKEYPLFRGLLRYFPAALAGVARHSKLGNDKHNPGEEMHHSRGKSADHPDCIVRHMLDMSDIEAEIERSPERSADEVAALMSEADALCWRALAWSQELHERYGGAPLAPGASGPPRGRLEHPMLLRAKPFVRKPDDAPAGTWHQAGTLSWLETEP